MQNSTEPPKKTSNKKEMAHFVHWGVTAFCVIAASMLVFFLLYRIPNIFSGIKTIIGILMPFIYGFAIAYLLLPFFNFLYRHLSPSFGKWFKRGNNIAKVVSSLISLGVGIIVVVGLVSMVLPQLVLSIVSLMESMDGYFETISVFIGNILQDNPVIERNFMQLYDQFTQEIMTWVQNIALPQLVGLMTSVMSTVSALFNVLVGVIIALYILNSKDTFCAQSKKIVYSLLPAGISNKVIDRVAHLHRVFGGFIIGKIIDSMIIGVICFVGLQIMGIPYAMLISVIIGVTNVIPFFGPFIGAIPSAILIFVISPVQAIYFVVFILLLQQFDGNILGPKILGDSTGLSSFWVMFAILVFGGIFGFVGMVVGVPIFAVIYSIIKEAIEYLLVKKGLPADTTQYRGSKRVDPQTNEIYRAPDAQTHISPRKQRKLQKEKEKKK